MVIQYPSAWEDPAARSGHGHEAVESAVRNALSSDFEIDGAQITVATMGSYVVLGGFARSPFERQRAEEIAADIVGGDRVRSRMLLRG